MRTLFALLLISASLRAEDKPVKIDSEEVQAALDSRDAKIKELSDRLDLLTQKLNGFAALYNSCEQMTRVQAISILPVTPHKKPEEKK